MAKPDILIGVYNGVSIYALPDYDTAYYFAPPVLKRNQQTRSLATVKRKIDAYVNARLATT